jgi:hypothetical protein
MPKSRSLLAQLLLETFVQLHTNFLLRSSYWVKISLSRITSKGRSTMHHAKFWLLACLVFLSASQFAFSDDSPDINEKVKDLVHMDGYFDLYWDQQKGQLLLRIDDMGEEFIYQSSLARGIGSNDLGLDRGQLGATRLVEFYRAGPKVLMIQKNLAYRANSDQFAEQAAVESSFARSVVWGFEVLAETDGSVLVDATDFFLRDSHGVSTWLSRAKQGSYKIDASRSAVFLPRTRAFPDNTEVEAIVSYTGEPKFDDKGAVVSKTLSTVVPDPTSVTVHLHHSFIRLPDDNYVPLPYDPRGGIIPAPPSGGFLDYAVPIGEPIRVLYGRRHRLEKMDPTADVSEAVEPIIYYLDPGAPEPVRSALMDGAGWWNQAFEATGYKNAFQVKMLPEDVDPMDVRYNVIQWVHRSTRGWSYGSSVMDPRTGEILKGHVTLGSLRVRQDYLIAEGLLAPYAEGQIPDTMLEMSLARIRQLAAHEVGHTLGIEHNFAASVNDRSSVMDYPFPLVKFAPDGGLDLSDAYGVGIGAWDKRTIAYAYQDFPDNTDDASGRQSIIEETIASGLLYVADSDSRNPGTMHPQGNLWDNGADAIVEFEHLLKVRAFALSNFSERNIRPGRPLATTEEVLVPIYLLHRFQVQAVAKLIGGQYFSYGMRGDGQSAPVIVAAGKQQDAIDTLISGLDPQVLILPQSLLDLIQPRPPGHSLGRETFARSTGVAFDPLSPAASLIGLTLDVMLNPQRAARMNNMHAVDSSQLDFNKVLAALNNSSWYAQRQANMAGAIQRLAGAQILHAQMALMANKAATSQVRAQALVSINSLNKWLKKQNKKRLDSNWGAHYGKAQLEIRLWLEDPAKLAPEKVQAAPPGGPIGN